MNDNNFRPLEYSRAFSEALYIAVETTRSEAQTLKNTLETDEQCKGHVATVVESKMMECYQAADLLEGQLKLHGHADFLRRMRDAGMRAYQVS